MPGTMLPLFILPDVCWLHVPYAPTLEGQYIIKNLVLISAAMVVGGTVRGDAGIRLVREDAVGRDRGADVEAGVIPPIPTDAVPGSS
jgi:hypothetical protein